MNTQNNSPLSWYKLSFITTGFILIINAAADLIATNFKVEYLSVMFDWEYPIYNIGLEGLFVFLCILGTYLITSKLIDFSFKTIIMRLVIMSVFYFVSCCFFQFILYFLFRSDDFGSPKSITSQLLNFKYLITGMRYSFILMVIWMVLKYRNHSNQKDSHNPEG